MPAEPWIIVTNLLLLPLWFGLWIQDDPKLLFNPYVLWIRAAFDRVTEFLHPVFRNLSPRAIALTVIAFLLVFRGLLVFNTLTEWTLTVAMTLSRTARNQSVVSCLGFSVITFLMLVAQVWTLNLAVELLSGGRRDNRAGQALQFTALPLRRFSRTGQALVIGALYLLMILAMDRLGHPSKPPITTFGSIAEPQRLFMAHAPVQSVLRLLLLSLGGLLDVLLLARNLMLLAVLLSLVGALLQRPNLQAIAQDWIQALLGRLVSRRTVYGGLDFSPILFMLITPLLYGFAITLIQGLIAATY